MFENTIRISIAFLVAAMVLTIAMPLSQAQQQCGPLQTVQWWDDIDHKTMTVYVDSRHHGDWAAYIAKWQNHLAMVQAVYDRGGAVSSKKLGLQIKGRELGNYIAAVENRLSVTRCLAKQEIARAAKKLEEMETASGANDSLPETVR